METNQILVDIHSSTRPIQSGQNLHNLHKFIMYFIHRKISSIQLNSTDIDDLGLEPLSHVDPYYQKKRNVDYKIEYSPYSRGDVIPSFDIKSKSGQKIQNRDDDEYVTLMYFINGFKIITGLRIVRYRQFYTDLFLDILDETESVKLEDINDNHLGKGDSFYKNKFIHQGQQSFLAKRWGNGEKYFTISNSFATKERKKEMIKRDAIDNCVKELREKEGKYVTYPKEGKYVTYPKEGKYVT